MFWSTKKNKNPNHKKKQCAESGPQVFCQLPKWRGGGEIEITKRSPFWVHNLEKDSLSVTEEVQKSVLLSSNCKR